MLTYFISPDNRSTSVNPRRTGGGSPAPSRKCKYNCGHPEGHIEHQAMRPERRGCANDLRARFTRKPVVLQLGVWVLPVVDNVGAQERVLERGVTQSKAKLEPWRDVRHVKVAIVDE